MVICDKTASLLAVTVLSRTREGELLSIRKGIIYSAGWRTTPGNWHSHAQSVDIRVCSFFLFDS